MSVPVYYSKKDIAYVWASELHQELEIATPLRKWMPSMIEYGFTEKQDFNQVDKKIPLAQGGFNIKKDWAITVDMAKSIAMIQRTPKGKEIRDYLLKLEKGVTEGEFINQAQLLALFDICKVMGFFSVQKLFKDEHFKLLFSDRKNEWWSSRARLFGYSKQELQDALLEIGKRYVNMEQAMFHVDRYNLIRVGVMDLFLAMGKSKAYAQNVGNMAKAIAKELEPEVYDDINTLIDFKSPEQKNIINDLEYKSSSKLIQQFTRKKSMPQLNSDYNQHSLFNNSTGNKELDDTMSKALKKKI